jgi:signal transduction histidine kinase
MTKLAALPPRPVGISRPVGTGRTIRDMISTAGSAHPVEFSAGWARWAALAVFTALVVVGVLPLHPSAVVASIAAVVAVAAGVMLVYQRRPLLLYAAIAAAGVTVLGHHMAGNIGWFAVCLIGTWCALVGTRREAVTLWGAALILFGVEWIWFDPDPGWGAWIAGTTLAVLTGLLVRQQLDLVSQLRDAQAGLADRTRAEERNRIGRELHDVIAHTLTVSLLHITSARLAVEHDPEDAARSLAEAERLGRESLEEVRMAVGLLNSRGESGRTTPLPGVDGLPTLVERFRSAGSDVSLTVDGDSRRLHATTGLAVYRIVQEAMTNAIKHGGGAPTAVRLAVDTETVRLDVDTASQPGSGSGSGSGLGLVSMRERAEALGGTCEAGPGGQGWLVAATLPLTPTRRREGAT